MNSFDLKQLGVTGTNSETDSYHFQDRLNKVTIEGNEDYRLVLFFIKKGTVMPIHDHPNMSVYFKLMFGKLNYSTFDKIDEKYRYNQLSEDEYAELLETKAKIPAKKSAPKLLENNNLLLVRPSCGNVHKFVAEEDSCFFDICLPNYTSDSLRRITYFNEVGEHLGCDGHAHESDHEHVKTDKSCENTTLLEYNTTPAIAMPNGFNIHELSYQGDMREDTLVPRKMP